MGPEEPTTIILLNDHSMKMTPNDTLLYPQNQCTVKPSSDRLLPEVDGKLKQRPTTGQCQR